MGSDARSRLEELPWPDIVNMRHRIVHAYWDVSLDILWDTVQVDLPELIAHLEAALEGDGSQGDAGGSESSSGEGDGKLWIGPDFDEPLPDESIDAFEGRGGEASDDEEGDR